MRARCVAFQFVDVPVRWYAVDFPSRGAMVPEPVRHGGVLVLASTVVICMTPLKSGEWWQASTAAGISTVALKGLQPFLPQEFAKYLPS